MLVDRGSCPGSTKIANIGAAGGIAGIIGFVDASVPFSFAFGGGTITIPGYAISQVDSTTMKGATTVKIDPANQLLLVGSVVSTSSRGPMYQDKRIKPEIGAPGASVSAEHGTGTDRTAFGGTSGATPMIAGSAALLLQFYRDRGEVRCAESRQAGADHDRRHDDYCSDSTWRVGTRCAGTHHPHRRW